MRKKWSYVNVIHFGDRTDPASVHNIAKMFFIPSSILECTRGKWCAKSRGEVWHLGIDQLFFVEIERGSNQSKAFYTVKKIVVALLV